MAWEEVKLLGKIQLVVCIVNVSILIISCATEDNDILNDPRKFNWVLDTLTNPRTYQSSKDDIWGSSETDVYTVGFVDAGGGEMWHYSGEEWKSIPLHVNQGGFLTIPFSLNAIKGFSRTEIYCSGSNDINYPQQGSLILKFNGMEWGEVITPNAGNIISLAKVLKNELYGGSLSKSYLHFNGTIWRKDSINIITPPNALMRITDFGEFNNDIYCMFEYQTEDGTLAVHYFLKKNSNSWTVVDSFIIDQSHYTYKWGTQLRTISGGYFYCFGSSPLLIYEGNKWVTELNEEKVADIDGPNDNNYIAVIFPGRVFHYNGTDWYEIPQLNNPTLRYTGVWFNGEEAFICGYTDGYPEKSIVWHGKK